MALPVIQSVSNGAYAQDGASCVITKPSGLAAGDLMVGLLVSSSDDGNTAGTITAPAGWSTYTSYSGTNPHRIYCFFREATSGDAAASDFTFTQSDTIESTTIGCLLRITGAYATSPFSGEATGTDATGDTTVSITDTIDLIYNDSLILMVISGRDVSSNSLMGTYVTSGTNPTWTEQQDTVLSAGRSHSFAVATSGITSPRALTSFGATAATNGIDDFMVLVVSIPAQASASGTAALLSADADFFTNASVTVGGTGTHSLLSADADHFSASGSATAPTQWTPAAKPSTTWTPANK